METTFMALPVVRLAMPISEELRYTCLPICQELCNEISTAIAMLTSLIMLQLAVMIALADDLRSVIQLLYMFESIDFSYEA